MAQYDLNLRDYQRIFRRRWKVILFSTILVAGFSFFFGKSRVPLYTTFSSVKIEETSTVAGLLLQRLTYSRWDNIETAQELIRSFPVMEEVARRMGIVDSTMTSQEVRNHPRLSRRINNMIGKVRTERSGKTNIIDIFVTSSDSREARDMAQYLAEVFVKRHRAEKARQDRETREFIEKQVHLADSLLISSELALKRFRERNPYPVVDDHVRIRMEELINLKNEERALEAEIKELQIQLDQIDLRLGKRVINPRTWADTSRAPARVVVSEGDTITLTWISSPQGDGPLGILNNQLINLEIKKRNMLERYKPEYPLLMELEQRIARLLSDLRSEVRGNLEVYTMQMDTLKFYVDKQEVILDKVPETQRRYVQLTRSVSLRAEQYDFLSEKLLEAKIREADQAEEVVVVRPAMLSERAININMARTIGVGIVIGLMLGLVLALLFETFDTSIGTIEDVEEYLQVPVLGVIPNIDIDSVSDRLIKNNPAMEENPHLDAVARLVVQFTPKDPVAEAYRTLRTTLQFRSINRPVKTIIATSAALQEGKSTTLVNLALTLAQDGVRVLLVGCNLRRPTIYKTFGLEQAEGVTDIVLGRVDWHDAVKGVTDMLIGGLGMDSILMTPGMENLHIITSGGIPPNPAEMLGSKRMKAFLDEARDEFDIVLLDGPPVLPVTDSSILANRCDATLLVYRTGKVPRAALKRAKVQLEAVGATVLGVVLNDLKANIAGYSGSHYYYGRYYGDANRRQDELVSEKGGHRKLTLLDRVKGLGGGKRRRSRG